jgi:hypothetical protein
VERLNADTDLELVAVVAGPADAEAETMEYFCSRGIEGRFIAYKQVSRDANGVPPRDTLPWLSNRWPYLNEVEAREQRHVDRTLKTYVIEKDPDCIIIDYLPSAYFVPSLFSMRTPIVTITLNREADFYQEMILRKISLYGRRAFWIPPYMDPKPDPWSYSGARSLFFVGNHGHFPNRDAIEWLATQFAPELETIAPSIRLKIVGANRAEVPEAWH